MSEAPLLERLRWYEDSDRAKTENEAADAIERLTCEVSNLKMALEAANEQLNILTKDCVPVSEDHDV